VTIRVPIGDVSTIFGSGAKILNIKVEINTAGLGPVEIIPHSASSTNNIAESTVSVVKSHNVSPSFAPSFIVLGSALTILAAIPAVNWWRKRRKDNMQE
jgi:hypothetical protein